MGKRDISKFEFISFCAVVCVTLSVANTWVDLAGQGDVVPLEDPLALLSDEGAAGRICIKRIYFKKVCAEYLGSVCVRMDTHKKLGQKKVPMGKLTISPRGFFLRESGGGEEKKAAFVAIYPES